MTPPFVSGLYVWCGDTIRTEAGETRAPPKQNPELQPWLRDGAAGGSRTGLGDTVGDDAKGSEETACRPERRRPVSCTGRVWVAPLLAPMGKTEDILDKVQLVSFTCI